MKNYTTYLSFILLSIFLGQCKTNNLSSDGKNPIISEEEGNLELGNGFNLYLLDSASAAQAIVHDKKDRFFERVTYTEMAIQMKENLECEERQACVQKYKDFLSLDVERFSSSETEKIVAVFEEMVQMITTVNPALIDRDIKLIKTKGNHYGDGVFYTRENKIIIPQDQLSNFNQSRFKETMLHEFFHVFSRYNEETRDRLYALIGFYPVNGKIIAPESLRNRKLLNPDGTTDYYIKIGEDLAYPMIVSNMNEYVPSKPRFFDYLDFGLYRLIPSEDGIYTIGKKIPFENASDFFTQIKDNTDYIIHPDEIMADNFIYTINFLADDKMIKNFSDEGMILINQMGTLLQDHM